jgi:hypothetical protein
MMRQFLIAACAIVTLASSAAAMSSEEVAAAIEAMKPAARRVADPVEAMATIGLASMKCKGLLPDSELDDLVVFGLAIGATHDGLGLDDPKFHAALDQKIASDPLLSKVESDDPDAIEAFCESLR